MASAGSLVTARWFHTATLLPDGLPLVVGGRSESGTLDSAEVYDEGLGYSDSWRPSLSCIAAPPALGDSLSLTGSGWRGFQFAEASGGGTNSSATSYPLVQVRRLDNEQLLWALPSEFDDTSYTSRPVTATQAGPALVTVFVNGIPGVAHPLTLRVERRVYLPLVLR